ncbi:phage recombination protein Bet [Leucobacter sp. HY1910]
MSTTVALPKSSAVEEWTAEERAIADAAGLVFRHTWGAQSGQVEPAPRAVVAKFLHTCARTGLDPLARQIYCIGRGTRDGVQWAIQTGIDGFRVIAERTGKYAGQDAAEWLTATGEWVPVFVKAIHGEHPLAARVNVYRSDWHVDKPAVGVATWDEYAQYTNKGPLTQMWAQRGPGQLAKCAEALALRKAFPQDLAGLYTDDEMQGRTETVEPEPSGIDWGVLIEAAADEDTLRDIAARLKESGEATDALRAQYAARLGIIQTETQDAEVVTDDEPGSDAAGSAGAAVSADDAGASGAADNGSE